jgi:hypothetical protein
MNPVLAGMLGLITTVALPALLIGLYVRTTRRKGQRSEPLPFEDSNRGIVAPPAEQRRAGVDLQLTTVLAESGEVLLGYRTSDTSAASGRSSTDVFPRSSGTLLVRPRNKDIDAALSTLDRWSREGIELALHRFDESDLMVLCDRRTSHRLVLSVIRAPCDRI